MTAASEGSSPLQWKLFIWRRASTTQGTPPGNDEQKWAANTVTLIYGEHDALLVGTFLSDAQTGELADWIASSGKRLSTVYITHAHADHFFGLKLLRDRFPEARAIALPQVADAMRAALAPEAVETWRRRFPGLIPSELVPAERLEGGTFDLEGHEIVPVDIGHTDTDHTTCLHVPSIDLVIAGDAIYNGTHPYLVESDHKGLLDWLAAIDKIEALNPSAVVVGHGPLDPDNSPRHIAETRCYIDEFIRLCGETATARELYDRMLALYPDCINPGSLWGSGNAAETHAAGQSMTLREALFVISPRIHEAFPHASAAGEFHQGGRAGARIFRRSEKYGRLRTNVVAKQFGAEKKLAALVIEWDDGPQAKLATEGVVRGSKRRHSIRDRSRRIQDMSTGWVEATDQVPFLAHAPMEPMNCTVPLFLRTTS